MKQILLLALFVFVFQPFRAQTYIMGNTTIATCSGTFLDPGGNADYPVGNNSTMVINPGVAGQFVTVNFAWFNIQQDWDVLYAYDGNSVAAPLIGIFSGTNSPGLIRASSANATGSLTFRFISNWWTSGPEPGWSATIACTAAGGSPVYSMKNGGNYTVCSGTFYDSGGANHTYTWNENSVMTFCPATAGQGIQLAFSPVDLEQDGDLLYIYDGASTASPLIAGFGNSDNVILPAQTITASTANAGGCLTASFVSDGWWQNPGWSAAISCVPKTAPTYAVMDGTISTCSGAFTDNGGANAPYMDFSDDILTICSNNPATPYVNVSFSGFDLWTNFDFLRVYDGTNTAAPLIANYTGILAPFMVSSGNASGCLTFRFQSDGWTQRFGWNATIACSPTIGLPVEWLSFTGERTEPGIVLEWETASENDSWYFEVQRYDGNDFDSIGYVQAAGNSTQVLHYEFLDRFPRDEWNYYRLRQVDFNGGYSYSSIVAIGPHQGEGDVRVLYQQDGFADQLQFAHLTGRTLSVDFYENTGALVMRVSISPQSAYETTAIEGPDLATGIYYVRISDNKEFEKVIPYIRR